MKEKRELIDAGQAIGITECKKKNFSLFYPIDLEYDIDDSRSVLRVNIERLKRKQTSFYLII